MKQVLVAFLFCAFTGIASAQTQAVADSIEWEKAFSAFCPDDEIKANYTKGLMSGLDELFDQLGATEDERTRCIEQLNNALFPHVKKSMKDFYKARFNTQELRELAAFLSTPLGKKSKAAGADFVLELTSKSDELSSVVNPILQQFIEIKMMEIEENAETELETEETEIEETED